MNMMKRMREKKTAERVNVEVIAARTTLDTTSSTVEVCTFFDVKVHISLTYLLNDCIKR